jgi:hypothetical protein
MNVFPKCKFIISRYKEDVSWIKEYTDNYIIYNKGEKLDSRYKSIELDNIGNNQYDIFHYIYTNYENLPDMMLFLQGHPFDHCKKEKFDKIIYNDKFTPFESYEDLIHGHASKADIDGGYMERNDCWYISAHNQTHNITCIYRSYDEFMNKYFSDYIHVDWIRFTPGSQYMVEKKQILKYSRDFWKSLMEELPFNNMTEGHIIERSLLYILTGNLTSRI